MKEKNICTHWNYWNWKEWTCVYCSWSWESKEDKSEKHTAQIFFIISIFIFIVWLVLWFIMWLRIISFENYECTPSQEHQEVMSWINKLLNPY